MKPVADHMHFAVLCGDDFYRPLCGEYAVDESTWVFECVTCPVCREHVAEHRARFIALVEAGRPKP